MTHHIVDQVTLRPSGHITRDEQPEPPPFLVKFTRNQAGWDVAFMTTQPSIPVLTLGLGGGLSDWPSHVDEAQTIIVTSEHIYCSWKTRDKYFQFPATQADLDFLVARMKHGAK